MKKLTGELYARFATDWLQTTEGQRFVRQSFPDGFTSGDLMAWLDGCGEFERYFDQRLEETPDELERTGKIYRIGDRYYPAERTS